MHQKFELRVPVGLATIDSLPPYRNDSLQSQTEGTTNAEEKSEGMLSGEVCRE